MKWSKIILTAFIPNSMELIHSDTSYGFSGSVAMFDRVSNIADFWEGKGMYVEVELFPNTSPINSGEYYAN